METIFINYKDLQFLIGCDTRTAKCIIYKHLTLSDKVCLNSYINIKAIHFVDAEKIDIRMSSFSETLHNQKQVIYTIKELRKSGLSASLKHEVLEDVNNIVRGGLYGKYRCLKSLLTIDQVQELENSLQKRRAAFLNAGNKIPKNLIKYANI